MGEFDLLRAVQPDDGWFAIVGIKDGANPWQELVETREEADTVIAQMLRHRRNVFFGVAKFKGDSSRSKGNVLSVKALWADVDCGENKGYPEQSVALKALRKFCKTVGLPRPIVVNSGRGLHVYWPLAEAVSREEWELLIGRLRTACLTHNFHADPACFEVARILRVPDTINFKYDTEFPVTVVCTAETVLTHDEMKDILGVKGVAVIPRKVDRPTSALGQMLADNIENSFTKIMKRGENGCRQLNAAYVERATLSEPRWFSALSVAKFCKDKDKAIHRLSADHPDYDPGMTEHKIAHILGPHTCAEFEKNNPGGCAGCPHAGKIKSPIMLGKEILEASDADNLIAITDEDTGAETHYHIPTYPFPFFRGKNGGIYLKADNEEAEDACVYERDFYIVKRMEDPQHGDVILARLHTSKDGIREFVIPNFKVMDLSELRKELASRGIVTNMKQFGALCSFVIASIKQLQDQEKAEQMRNQFGWADRDSKFIIGDKEVGVQGTLHSPPSSVTASIAEHMTTAGTLEAWRDIANLYGKPGLEAHAFGAATAFGAPLLRFSGQSGAIINLIHPRSGTGKTTVLHMCNSVWGHPKKLCSKKDDTFNSKVHKLGVHGTLPICFDEMSNTDPKQLSELAYLITQGTGKDRMRGAANELRLNLTTWQTIALCSSNHSFYEKLEHMKNSPEGEVMRIIEYHLDYTSVLGTAYAKDMFDHKLMENYGHAGEIYARYLLTNLSEVKAIYARTQKYLDKALNLSQRERFWSATVAANIAGIRIANRLKLIDWDLRRMFKWACCMINELRTTTTPPIDSDKQVLGEFMIRNLQNLLVINGNVDLRTSNLTPMIPYENSPKRDLNVRYEPDTRLVFVVTRAFKDYCQERNVSYRETIKQLKQCGMLMRSDQKRMSKGMKINTPPVAVLIFDGNHPEFVSMDDLAEVAKQRAGDGKDDTEESNQVA